MLTETFELLDPTNGNRDLIWSSDENIDVRVQLKLLNNYPKYFAITSCKDNEILTNLNGSPYNAALNQTSPALTVGSGSIYGVCFDEGEVWVNGTHLNANQTQFVSTAYLCFDYETACPELATIPTVGRRQSPEPEYWWNYADEVNSYYPSNYITDDMWDLTHSDYDDNAFAKAYKYRIFLSR
jgi:hypothetical protein